MRSLLLASLLPLVAACSSLSSASPSATDEIKATVELYFAGHATGDGTYWRRAFHPVAVLYWVKDGALATRPLDEFVAGATGKPAPDEDKRGRKITLVDVAEDAAVVKVELDYPDVKFVDYLSLLRVEGRWVIVNKIFHRQAKVPSSP
jgi:hypothetical protein